MVIIVSLIVNFLIFFHEIATPLWLFSKTFKWCETQKDCNRLRLIDILVRPMQRLTKYSLLLKVKFRWYYKIIQIIYTNLMFCILQMFLTYLSYTIYYRQYSKRQKMKSNGGFLFLWWVYHTDYFVEIMQMCWIFIGTLQFTLHFMGSSYSNAKYFIIEQTWLLEHSIKRPRPRFIGWLQFKMKKIDILIVNYGC